MDDVFIFAILQLINFTSPIDLLDDRPLECEDRNHMA